MDSDGKIMAVNESLLLTRREIIIEKAMAKVVRAALVRMADEIDEIKKRIEVASVANVDAAVVDEEEDVVEGGRLVIDPEVALFLTREEARDGQSKKNKAKNA